ncbi:MAG TPA: M23 family metallopeptidase [Methylophilus sp.]|nr:M23 family metallopeptidase [Methylophilus sp.]HQQ32272.1 M23 family metallopeptidase [Methylophilus sp.]
MQRDKLRILSQNLLLTLRKSKMRWAFVALLPLFAILAAFGTAPDEPNPANIKVKTIVQEVTLPLPVKPVSLDEEFWQMDQVRNDDTLASLFRRMTIRDEDAIRFLTISPEARAINTALIPGHNIEIKTNLEGKLLHLEYEVDKENILVAGLTPLGYQVTTQKLLLQRHEMLSSARIVDNLFSATDEAGIPDSIVLQIAEIFSGDIDFMEDLRPGDTLNVVYEAFYNAGELMKVGNILAVEYINDSKKYTAIRFGDAEGKYAYYTLDGKSLHKSFLRSPVEFTRISSNFNKGRFHPILHRFRAHQGTDFAAPIGTRVKAAGDGEVNFIGRKGGYGNVVAIKHDNGISTVYGHLSRFESGLRKGQRVTQSDIIGYVGMTGLATGPHLHYEFLQNGVRKDPLKVALPVNIPIDAKLKPAFDKTSRQYQAQLSMLNQRQMASKE